MSITRTKHTTSTLHASSSVANAGSATDDFDLATSGYGRIYIQCDLDAASGSPAGDVTLEVFYTSDGSNYDTIPVQKIAVPFSATGNKKVSLAVEGYKGRLKMSNATGVSITYIARQDGVTQETT